MKREIICSLYSLLFFVFGNENPFNITSLSPLPSIYDFSLDSVTDFSSSSSSSSSTLPFHLTYHPVIESNEFCHKISPLLNYSFDECLGLSFQSHRTLRQFYFEIFFQKYSLPLTDFSFFLSLSYGIETCIDTTSSITLQPIDICFFGNTATTPSLILMTLLSCEAYRIHVFHFHDNTLYEYLMKFRDDFPLRTIRWIYGSYTSYFSSDSPPPHCNIIVIDEKSSLELSDIQNFPIPSPLFISNLNDNSSLLRPCRGNGLIIHYQPLHEPITGKSKLSAAYKRSGVNIDWRLMSIATNMTENASVRDYEGFAYRLFRHATPLSFFRIHFGCISSLHKNSFIKLLPSSNIKIHPHVASSLLLSSPSSSQYCPAIVITYTNRFFYENAIGIKQAIEQVIISLFPDTFNTLTISVWPDMTLGLLLPLDHCPIPPLQISIAPHEDTLLLRNYVVFNMEQLWSPYMKNERYLTILREARAVWTFSSQHLEYLLSIGINAENIWFLPIYTDQRYLLSTYQLYTSTTTTTTSTSSGTVSENPLSAFPQKDFDVLVFGSFSIRRNDIVQEMLRNISQYTSSFDFYRVLSGVQYSLMRDRRDDYVRRSKIVLNIHTEDESSLEVHRLNYLLSMGACIISEYSSDPALDSIYKNAVVFTSKEGIVPTILALLQDHHLRDSIERTAFNFASSAMRDTTVLTQSLKAALSAVR